MNSAPNAPTALHPQDLAANPTLSAQDLQDIIEVYPNSPWQPTPWLLWIGATLALVAAFVLGRWIYSRYKRRAKINKSLSPQQQLRKALQELEKAPLSNASAFYTQWRHALNAYLLIAWQQPCEALSPEELLAQLDLEESTRDARIALRTAIGHYTACLFAGQHFPLDTCQTDLDALKKMTERLS